MVLGERDSAFTSKVYVRNTLICHERVSLKSTWSGTFPYNIMLSSFLSPGTSYCRKRAYEIQIQWNRVNTVTNGLKKIWLYYQGRLKFHDLRAVMTIHRTSPALAFF